jgi:hypothetical protein
MKSCKKILPLIALLGLVLLAGCASDKGTESTTPTDAIGWVNLGWSQYLADDLNGAQQSFAQANDFSNAALGEAQTAYFAAYSKVPPDTVAMAAALADVNYWAGVLSNSLSGFGWTTVKTGSAALGTLAFGSALDMLNNPYLTLIDSLDLKAEVLAGYAFLLMVNQNWNLAIERADSTLQMDPNWVFRHDPNRYQQDLPVVNHQDLQLLKTECYYFTAEFESSLQALNGLLVEITSPTMQALINSYLPPELAPLPFDGTFNPNLASAAGQTKLIQVIQVLDIYAL